MKFASIAAIALVMTSDVSAIKIREEDDDAALAETEEEAP